MLAIKLRQEILFCPLEALDVTSNYLLEAFETANNFLFIIIDMIHTSKIYLVSPRK